MNKLENEILVQTNKDLVWEHITFTELEQILGGNNDKGTDKDLPKGNCGYFICWC